METVLKTFDLSSEEWREYVQFDETGKVRALFRLESPRLLTFRDGGTTHRVTDQDGSTYAFPVTGPYSFIPHWKSKDPKKPVEF